MPKFSENVLLGQEGSPCHQKYRRRHPLKGTDGVRQSRMTTPSAPSKELRDIFLMRSHPSCPRRGVRFLKTGHYPREAQGTATRPCRKKSIRGRARAEMKAFLARASPDREAISPTPDNSNPRQCDGRRNRRRAYRKSFRAWL